MNKDSHKSLKLIAFLTWVVTIFLMSYALITSGGRPSYWWFKPYYWFIFFLSLISLIGLVIWRNVWRVILITSASLYLVAYLLNFWLLTLMLPEVSFLEAVVEVFLQKCLGFYVLLSNSKYSILRAFFYALFEWGIPMVQLIFLAKLVSFSGSSKRLS